MPTFDLDFIEPAKGEIPFAPVANVSLKEWTKSEEGRKHLIPDCTNPRNFDYWISKLVEELETIRRDAHKRFDKSPFYLNNIVKKKQPTTN